jgi:outer membrane protein assembly factor BamB
VGSDDTSYSAFDSELDPAVTARRPDGTLLWSTLLPAGAGFTVVRDDGVVLTGHAPTSVAGGAALVALSPSGAVLWSVSLGHDAPAGAAIAPDGTAYVAAGRRLLAVDETGTVRWSILRRAPVTRPLVGGDGIVYVGGSDGLLALRPDGTTLWRAAGPLAPRAIGPDGTLYAAGSEVAVAFQGPVGPIRMTGFAVAPRRFRATATIRFALTRPATVSLAVRHADGRLVRRVRLSRPSGASALPVATLGPLGPGAYLLAATAAAGGRSATTARVPITRLGG